MDLIPIYYDSGELNKAVDVLRTLQSAKSDGPDVLYAAYRTYSDLAAKALASLAEAAPESAPMHQILAQNLASRDDFQGAIGEYRRAIALDSRLPSLHYELAQVVLANSTEQVARNEAEQEFRRELALNPSSAESEYMLGGLLAWLQSKARRRTSTLPQCTAAPSRPGGCAHRGWEGAPSTPSHQRGSYTPGNSGSARSSE